MEGRERVGRDDCYVSLTFRSSLQYLWTVNSSDNVSERSLEIVYPFLVLVSISLAKILFTYSLVSYGDVGEELGRKIQDKGVIL